MLSILTVGEGKESPLALLLLHTRHSPQGVGDAMRRGLVCHAHPKTAGRIVDFSLPFRTPTPGYIIRECTSEKVAKSCTGRHSTGGLRAGTGGSRRAGEAKHRETLVSGCKHVVVKSVIER